jgi:flagellar biosynthesis protein FliR
VTFSLEHIFSALLTIGARLTGLMLFAPFLGNESVPVRVKAILVLALTALLYPSLAASIPVLNLHQWPMTLFSELVIGSATGIATNLVFDGAQLAGELLSVQMGYSLASIFDPQTQAQSTVVATFHQMIAMLIFLRLDIHFLILRGLAHSFEYMPPASGHIHAGFVITTLHTGAAVFATGLQIAAPVLCATLVADIALGLLGKASPQLPVMLLGPAIKSILGLTILMCALKYWPDEFERLFIKSMGTADHLLHLAT